MGAYTLHTLMLQLNGDVELTGGSIEIVRISGLPGCLKVVTIDERSATLTYPGGAHSIKIIRESHAHWQIGICYNEHMSTMRFKSFHHHLGGTLHNEMICYLVEQLAQESEDMPIHIVLTQLYEFLTKAVWHHTQQIRGEDLTAEIDSPAFEKVFLNQKFVNDNYGLMMSLSGHYWYTDEGMHSQYRKMFIPLRFIPDHLNVSRMCFYQEHFKTLQQIISCYNWSKVEEFCINLPSLSEVINTTDTSDYVKAVRTLLSELMFAGHYYSSNNGHYE